MQSPALVTPVLCIVLPPGGDDDITLTSSLTVTSTSQDTLQMKQVSIPRDQLARGGGMEGEKKAALQVCVTSKQVNPRFS